MNTLRITLLLSMLMFPGVAFSTDGDSSADGAEKTTQEKNKLAESLETPKSTEVVESESSEDHGSLDTSSENNTSSFLGSAAKLAYWPVGLAVGSIDWIAKNTLIVGGIKKLAVLKGLQGNRVGKWLTNHNKGLSRAVVVALIGGVVYYYWKKCQECKVEEDEKFRITGFDGSVFNEDDAEIIESAE